MLRSSDERLALGPKISVVRCLPVSWLEDSFDMDHDSPDFSPTIFRGPTAIRGGGGEHRPPSPILSI